MTGFSLQKNQHWKKIGFALLIIFALDLFLLWGINGESFLRQIVFWFLGLTILFLIVKIRFALTSLSDFKWILYGIHLVLLILPLLLGKIVRGSARWVSISEQSFQPSEFAKPIFIIFLASVLEKISQGGWRDFLTAALPVFPSIFLLLLQPDLGTTLVFCFITGIMLFASRIQKKIIVLSLALCLPIFFISAKFLLADYQQARIQNFLNPGADPLGQGYNLLQSEIALGSGRLFGRGLGLGGQTRLFFLPERHTDFIFASLGENFGFFGTTLLIVSYGYLLWTLWQNIARENDEFIFLLKTGLIGCLWFQTIVGMGMSLGLLPITGLPIPLFSYGGSSLLVSLASLGLIIKLP